MSPTPALLEIDGLSSGYDGTTILRELSLSVAPGEAVVVLGRNGMGKSTLLKTIMGFVPASSGSIRVRGEEIASGRPHLNARRGIAYTPQEYAIFQDLTVRENLRLGVTEDSVLEERMVAVEHAFPIVASRSSQRAGTLSGGEQKMLLLSRALIARPTLMLIDEISEGLQPSMVETMAEVLRDVRDQQGVAILFVEQNLPFALSVADRYAILKIGEIVERGRVDDTATVSALERHLSI